MSRPRRPLLSAVAVLAGSLALPLAPVTAASAATVAAPVTVPVTAPVAPRCDKPLLAEPKRAARVEADAPATFATAARRNGESIADFAAVAEDRTLWLDECGKGFFVEPRRDAGETPTVADATVDNPDAHLPAGVDPLSLQSRPGAPRTLYLDFDGETVVGTGWNASRNLPEIVAPPYSITAPADTNFSSDERDQIYRAWLTVAEDYAPFDINVTTQHPGAAALARTDSSDQSYGTRVVIGEVDALYDICTCGGQAYIDVFDTTGAAHDYYQPAWVYTHSMADDGWSIGQAASHEVGHNFGLRHDGQGSTPYYRGTNSWAPIMGVSYYSVLAQWSQGTYAGATNTEDDLALIAGGAPLLADDHGDTAATATSVDGAEPVAGLITTRTDRDAFTFTAGGPTRFSAYADTQDTNLDLDLTVLDDTGTPIEVADPSLLGDEQAHPTPDALSATWVADLPAERRTYTVLVDGGDNQGFVVSQPYDDYGSLGRYRVALDTAPGPGDPDPLALTPSGDLVATEGDPVDASPATVTGGVAPYTWTAAGLPSGLTLDAATGRVTGAFDHEDDGYLTLTVRDARGAWRSVEVRYVVAAGESLVVLDSDWTFEEGTPVEDTLLVATGALSTPTWSVHAGQVPPGLTLGSGGSLTGTPTAPGDFTFTAQARTARSTALATVRVAVRAAYVAPPAPPTLPPVLVPPPTTTAPPPTVSPPTTTPVRIATRSLPKAKVRRAYQATVALQRAVPGTVWKVTKGKLPPGVTMRISADRSKAILTGKPKVKGTFTFRLTARAGSSRSARILEIQVR